MAKKNYAAWNIDTEQLNGESSDAEKLRLFARFAVLAPSGHNTQPWKVKFTSNSMILMADENRILPYSGLEANEPLVSLGSFLGIFELAAKSYGYQTQIKYSPDSKEKAIIKISSNGTSVIDKKLLIAIKNRVSNRFRFEETPLNKELETAIDSLSQDKVKINIVSNRQDIKEISSLTSIATKKIMSDREFKYELSKWVRNGVTRKYDGMPGTVQGIPTPPSMIAKHIVRHTNISKDQAKKDSSRVLNSSSIIIISVKKNSNQAYIDGGRAYSKICVIAELHGFATAGVGAAIIDKDTRKIVSEMFSLDYVPIAIIRSGKALKKGIKSPRHTLERIEV